MNDNAQHQLPPTETWWPSISADAKHTIVNDLDGPLDHACLQEIAAATGTTFTEEVNFFLSEEEKRFIRTQTEPVD